METIRTYLNNMFLSLPNTKEVQRAKSELLQMMEDKYSELKKEGKTENEAVGIVISEFGNLDEIAESLGISGFVHPWKNSDNAEDLNGAENESKAAGEGENERESIDKAANMLTLDKAKQYIGLKLKNARMTALGVMLCIFSPCGPIFFDALGEYMGEGAKDFMDGIGACFLLIMIAAAVSLFVIADNMLKDFKWVEKKRYVTDFATVDYVEKERRDFHSKYTIYMSVGITLCILCVIPTIILDSFHAGMVLEDISGGIVLILVGVGVFFIVSANMTEDIYEKILKHSKEMGQTFYQKMDNGQGGEYAGQMPYQDTEYDGKDKKGSTPSLYWPTITCIYLCWSFLSFDWNITWIIWPVAALVNTVLGVYAKEKK